MKRLLIALAMGCGLAAAQEFANLKVEKIAGGFQFTEGPVWSTSGYLLFSDIPASKILKWEPGKDVEVYRADTHNTNGNMFDSHGRLYSCEGGARRVVRAARHGKIEVLAEKFQGKVLNSPNDVVVRRDGHVYFSDPAWGERYATHELPWSVYHITPKGEIELVAASKGRPNGLAFSPDGKILYVDNSDEKTVKAYDVDASGKTSNERVIVSGIDGVPDGMRVDVKGNLYVTANQVEIYSPEGKHLGSIPVPEVPANCAFGGPDLQTLYITARTSVYQVHVPYKGSLEY